MTGPERRGRHRGPSRRGLVLGGLAVLTTLAMLLHADVPNRVGNVGSLVETFLPWSALLVPVLLAGAVARRSASAAVLVLLPVAAWLTLFGGELGDRSHPGGDLVVASHNVGADNADPAGTARDLITSGADVLALEELTDRARVTYERELAAAYPHHTVLGTVGLWSRLPLSDVRPLDLAVDYGPLADTIPADVRAISKRALRATVATHQGPLAVYVAHLGPARVNPLAGFATAQRDRGATALGAAIAAEPNPRVVLLGDLNGTMGDRAFAPLTSPLRPAQEAAGAGLGFTWPARLPVVRIDQVLVRGVEPTRSWVLPATGSDHLPVAAAVRW